MEQQRAVSRAQPSINASAAGVARTLVTSVAMSDMAFSGGLGR